MAKSNTKATQRSQRRKKNKAIEYLGGKCSVCGYNKCYGALDFHHINPEEKEASPSYIIQRWSWERVKKEIDKCILMCSNCHREHHYNQEIETEYKRPYLEEVEKTCPQCQKQYMTKLVRQKFCSQTCAKQSKRVCKRPSKERLLKNVEELGYCGTGRKYGVSSTTIRKWIKTYS